MNVLRKIGGAFRFLWKNMGTRVWLMVTSILMALFVSVSVVVTQVSLIYGTLNILLGGERAVIGEYDGERKFTADYSSQNAARDGANELTQLIEEEGIVLLKNEENALPLQKGAKISVFGKNSANIVYGGSGSSGGRGKMTDLYTALNRAGFEVNGVLREFYENANRSGSGRGENPAMGDIIYGFATGETPISSYSDREWNSVRDYDDAAIMVVSRIGGEGFDLPRTMRVGAEDYTPVEGASSADDHYLELDANEKALLKELYNKFDKVILLLNTPGSFELDFVNDPSSDLYSNKLKGGLWMGFPGGNGTLAVGRVLCGEVTPSGHTTDTWATDFLASPAIANFGNNNINKGNRYYYIDEGKDKQRNSSYFVDYEEGIYVGYRWYETRGLGDEAWYEQNVAYPFGYGLSYANFDWEVTQAPSLNLSRDGKISISVKVTNSLDSAYTGKDVVQLYYTAPYTSGGIEKSSVVLGGFAKTKLLKPGESEVVTIEMNVEDMKSYDYNDANRNDFIGYELEAGTYTIHVAHSAHEFEQSFDCILAANERYEQDTTTGVSVVNRFDDVSSHIENYLSRDGWTGMPTTPTEADRLVTKEFDNSLTWVQNDEGQPWTSNKEFAQNQSYGLVLADFIGIDYTDTTTVFTSETTDKEILLGKTYAEGWELLLDQLTAEEMATMIGTGAFSTIAIEKIGKPMTNETDGSSGITNFMSVFGTNTCIYAAECVLSATWNVDLAYEMGKALGNEALLTTLNGQIYSGWYAPAANIHRTPFGGRNWEYYSEDGMLSGEFAAAVVQGCASKGVYCCMKHFAVNDQETNRDTNGLITWVNEQSMREIYFKPFEIAVKKGGTMAMMSSFNRIGTVWAGGNYELLTSVLRHEWGFKGLIIDDYGLTKYINQEQVIRAGGDLMLIQGSKIPNYTNVTSTQLSCLRNATKHILYTVANSNVMEYEVVGYRAPMWLEILIIVESAAMIAFAIWGVCVIIGTKRKMKA